MKFLGKELNIPRLVIAGATSGVGKTSITSAIIYGIKKSGYSVQASRLVQIILILAIFPQSQEMIQEIWTSG